ncbi:MAG: S-layer homology domain-containing protein [Ruminiclostridium sp.]|nr:S-layer homology domain-containing protein [Ruminiclostridium sp.]
MKFKKTLSAALAMSLFATQSAVVSFAELDEAMKTALTYVKERIEIPEELSEFNYSKNIVYGKNSYSFTWETDQTKSENYECINTTIRGKVITQYERYGWGPDDVSRGYSFSKLSPEEILGKMREWLDTLNPTVSKNIEIDEDSLFISVSSETARATINRVSEGVPVKGQSGSIAINKDTGELISYGLDWVLGAGFPAKDKAISESEAVASFSEKIPLELVYTTSYDWEADETTPHLVYRQTDFTDVDALTGELTTFEGSYFNYYGDSDDDVTVEEDADMEAGATVNGGVNFTDKELEKLEKEGTLIRAEDALAKLVEMDIFHMGDNPAVSSSYTRYNEDLECYMMDVDFASKDTVYYVAEDKITGETVEKEKDVTISGSFYINAENGEIMNFYSWGGTYDEYKITAASAKKLLKKYADTLAGDKADEFKTDDIGISYSRTNKDGTPYKGAKVTGADLFSYRYAYDIPCTSESLMIDIDREGKITSYNMNYMGIDYPAPENILTEEEAFGKYFEQVDYSLQHRLAIKENKVYTAMVYNADRDMYIDAFSGKLTNYNGTEVIKQTKGGYTDLEGSKYRKIAEKLAVYNITLMDENGRLNEDEYITREEFSNLASRIGCYYYNRTGGDKVLTRQFAAKILTSDILSEECAELAGVFKSPFSDVKDNNKYVGYIAVAVAKGVMKEAEAGKFCPSKKVTRGQALRLIYNILA